MTKKDRNRVEDGNWSELSNSGYTIISFKLVHILKYIVISPKANPVLAKPIKKAHSKYQNTTAMH